MNRLAIIVISWNNSDDAIECLESLSQQRGVEHLTLLSIDNASTDGSATKLQEYISTKPDTDIQFIETGNNGGTAGGFNAGIKWAIEHNYDYIGTLNADAVAEPLWAASLVKELSDHEDTGIATGLLLRRDGKTIDTSGDLYTIWGIPGPRLRDAKREFAPTAPEYVFGSTGGGFIAKTATFRDIGLFDEAFFMYYEDVDISFRAQLRGYKVRYTPDAIAYHKLGASSKTVPGLAIYNTFKNLPMLFTKNVPLKLWGGMYPRFLLTYTLILANAVKNGQGNYALKGWLKSWWLVPHMFTERWHIQKIKTVSAAYINSILLHDIPPEQTGMRKFRKFFTGKE